MWWYSVHTSAWIVVICFSLFSLFQAWAWAGCYGNGYGRMQTAPQTWNEVKEDAHWCWNLRCQGSMLAGSLSMELSGCWRKHCSCLALGLVCTDPEVWCSLKITPLAGRLGDLLLDSQLPQLQKAVCLCSVGVASDCSPRIGRGAPPFPVRQRKRAGWRKVFQAEPDYKPLTWR